ncbi:MAG: peptidylprolyl isomerase [Myxococcota bacterium]|nr:peptidylprolyl isomerase [Myxococcota bacterium]
MSPASSRGSRRALGLLALGAATGLALAAWGLLSAAPGEALPPRAVVTVNGVPIGADDLARLVAGVESDTGAPADATMRRHVLDRLIDEELLVQRGLELGLAGHDRRVRADLAAAVIRSVVVEAEDREPSPEELRAFYEAERALFTRPGRLHVRRLRVHVPAAGGPGAARDRAEEAARRLRAGEPMAEVRASLGDPAPAPIPDAPLPSSTLREYLGPTLLGVARELAPGEVGGPVRVGSSLHVLQLVDRAPASAPPLAAIEEPVRAEWRRRQGEEALRGYLDELRSRAALRFAPDAPESP